MTLLCVIWGILIGVVARHCHPILGIFVGLCCIVFIGLAQMYQNNISQERTNTTTSNPTRRRMPEGEYNRTSPPSTASTHRTSSTPRTASPPQTASAGSMPRFMLNDSDSEFMVKGADAEKDRVMRKLRETEIEFELPSAQDPIDVDKSNVLDLVGSYMNAQEEFLLNTKETVELQIEALENSGEQIDRSRLRYLKEWRGGLLETYQSVVYKYGKHVEDLNDKLGLADSGVLIDPDLFRTILYDEFVWVKEEWAEECNI